MVFPSQVLADRWLEACLKEDGLIAIRRDRFISWDAYKDRWYRDSPAHPPVNRTERLVLAAAIISEQADALGTLFGEVSAGSLIRPVAALLPNALRTAASPVLADQRLALAALGAAWESRLSELDLSDPEAAPVSELPPAPSACLVFPELLLDGPRYFGTRDKALAHLPVVNLDRFPATPGSGRYYRHFHTDRDERYAALSLLRDELETGTVLSDLALSVSGLQQCREDLASAARLVGVPLVFRSGTALSGSLPGRWLNSLIRAARSGFRAELVAELTGFATVPLRDGPALEAAMNRVRKKGPISVPRPGQTAPLLLALGSDTAGRSALSRLMERSSALIRARDAVELRGAWSSVLDRCVDGRSWGNADERALQRMNDLLNDLASAEGRLGITVSDPLARWTDLLDQERYVPQSSQEGVPVFEYRVLAGAPLAVHVLIGADADAVKVQSSPYGILPPVLESVLADGIPNLTSSYLRGYGGTRALHLSMARFRRGTASAVPAPLLKWGFPTSPGAPFPAPDEADSHAVARTFATADGQQVGADGMQEVLARPPDSGRSPVLNRGLRFAAERALQYRKADLADAPLFLSSAEGLPPVSASALGRRIGCPFAWLVGSEFRASAAEAPSLHPYMALGSAVHSAVAEFLPSVLEGSDPEDAAPAIRDHIRAYLSRELSVSEALLPLLAARATETARVLLSGVAEAWPGAVCAGIERVLEGAIAGLPIRGRVDAMLQSADGRLVIVDFKTGRPARIRGGLKVIETDTRASFPEYQLQAYVLLASGDAELASSAQGWQAEYRFAFADEDSRAIASSGTEHLTEAAGTSKLARLLADCEQAAAAARTGTYAVPGDGEGCAECPARAVCRQRYVVR